MNAPNSTFAALARLLSTAMLLPLSVCRLSAQNATWLTSPESGDWNAASNWTENALPRGVATFGGSNVTNVTISEYTTVNGIIFETGGDAFTFTFNPATDLIFSGAGIANNSGVTQSFVLLSDASANRTGDLLFQNTASAGSATVFTATGGAFTPGQGAHIMFSDTSSAGSATINNNGGVLSGGHTTFGGASTAADCTIINNSDGAIGRGYGQTIFYDTATAGNSTINNNGGSIRDSGRGTVTFRGSATAGSANFTNGGGTVDGASGGTVFFTDSSTAGNATLTNNGGTESGASGGYIDFRNTATAGGALLTTNGGSVSGAYGGSIFFLDSATAGDGLLTANGGAASGAKGGSINFSGSSSAGSSCLVANGGANGGEGGSIRFSENSSGGTATIKIYGNGNLDISQHSVDLGVAIGSLEGTGQVLLGAFKLTVGSNDRSTTFSGVIDDWMGWGSLIKVGSGTLALSGANTYHGLTTISGGTVLANNTTGSAFGPSGLVTVGSGATLGGNGFIDSMITITAGGHLAPGNSFGTLTFTNDLSVFNYDKSLIFEVGSILDFQIGSTSDRIDVACPLYGPEGTGGITLNLADAGGFAPDSTYTLFNFVSGNAYDFDVEDFSLGTLIPGTAASGYSLSLTSNSLDLIYHGSASAVPEPASCAAVFGIGVFGLALRRRRR